MSLVTTTEMFKKAYDGGYAVGAFNVNNMEIVQGITEAAGELKSPVILQVSKGARAYANHTYLVKLVEAAVIENPEIPIALHLDHGDTFELCKSCIDGGFTSVMIDASSKSFEDNIALTKQVVEYAHDHGVVVEAELGTLAGIEDEVVVEAGHESYTRPVLLRLVTRATQDLKRLRNSFPEQDATHSLSLSVHHTVLTSSQQPSAQEMLTAFSYLRRSVSTFSKSASRDSLVSRSFFTVLLPYLRNSLRWLMSTAETCLTQLVSLRSSSVRQLHSLFARSTSTLISVLL